jgi:dTDP-4-amino-4,6-dideoxygalactose transaminase
VLDPLKDCGWGQDFFRVDTALEMDVQHVERLLAARQYGLLLLIHFFGFPQAGLGEARALCDRYGVTLVEDCAHVLHGGDIGIVGDASFFSIHKTLPIRSGGILQLNHGPEPGPVPSDAEMQPDALSTLARAVVQSIARKRIENYERLSAALSGLRGVTLFRRERPRDAVPLNLPVLLQPGADRFAIYNHLNDRGIGSTALYYRLVDEIEESSFPVSHDISRRILNLPIHQEIDTTQINRMVEVLHEVVG